MPSDRQVLMPPVLNRTQASARLVRESGRRMLSYALVLMATSFARQRASLDGDEGL
jgi:hypothetical protein